MSRISSCVIQVGYDMTMNEEDISDVRRALIFRVPKTLRDFNDRLYNPHLVSIGPFHYGKEELKGMEKSKSEAVRRMQKRIQKKNGNVSIQSIVEESIVLKEKEIREFYGEHITQFTSIELAWMVTRDACFLFEFLVNYVGSSTRGKSLYDKEVTSFSWTYDPIFDVTYQNPTREKLMDDILLFENQIPLWVLQHLLQVQMGSTEAADQRLGELMDLLLIRTTRHKVFVWHREHPYNKCCHVLEVVYHGMVGTNVSSYLPTSSGPVVLPHPPHNRIQVCLRNFVAQMKSICKHWYRSPGEEELPTVVELTSRGVTTSLLEKQVMKKRPEMPRFLKLPTAVELTRMGVKIRPVLEREVVTMEPSDQAIHRRGVKNHQGLEGELCTREPSHPAIQLIRFDKETSTLYLPEFRITPHSDSIMRSIIAMEVSIKSRYHPRPMTQFGIFMDELIDTEEDVAVLRKAEVISNFLESNQQVADLFNSLTKGIAPDRCCKVIYEAREGLYFYTRRKHKILWNEFVSTYFSKPWQIAGTMGAMLLLLMTAAQVICLFLGCNR